MTDQENLALIVFNNRELRTNAPYTDVANRLRRNNTFTTTIDYKHNTTCEVTINSDQVQYIQPYTPENF